MRIIPSFLCICFLHTIYWGCGGQGIGRLGTSANSRILLLPGHGQSIPDRQAPPAGDGRKGVAVIGQGGTRGQHISGVTDGVIPWYMDILGVRECFDHVKARKRDETCRRLLILRLAPISAVLCIHVFACAVPIARNSVTSHGTLNSEAAAFGKAALVSALRLSLLRGSSDIIRETTPSLLSVSRPIFGLPRCPTSCCELETAHRCGATEDRRLQLVIPTVRPSAS